MRGHNGAAMDHCGKALRRKTQRLCSLETQKLQLLLTGLWLAHASGAPLHMSLGWRRLRPRRAARRRFTRWCNIRRSGGWLAGALPVERCMLAISPQPRGEILLPCRWIRCFRAHGAVISGAKHTTLTRRVLGTNVWRQQITTLLGVTRP